jgi:hypothetical protein
VTLLSSEVPITVFLLTVRRSCALLASGSEHAAEPDAQEGGHVMSDLDRLTECGFRLALKPFLGVGGRLIWFASRVHEDSDGRRSVHFFYVDFAAGRITRAVNHGAEYRVWDLEDAFVEFGPDEDDLTSASFLDRLQVMGFRLQRCDDDSDLGIANYWGSIGDGSRWLIHSDAEKLTRFDICPIRIYRLDGMRIVDCSGSGSINLEPDPPKPAAEPPKPVRRGLLAEPWRPLEYSGAKVSVSLFGDELDAKGARRCSDRWEVDHAVRWRDCDE